MRKLDWVDENNPEVICKFLYAIANSSDAISYGHDVILFAAAKMIERYDENERRAHLSNKAEA